IIKLLSHGSNGLVANTAGYYILEIGKVCIYIERKSMHGNPAARFYTQRTNLSRIALCFMVDPNTSKSLYATRLYTIFFECKDNGFLQKSQVFMDICKKIVQVKDWITHYLARTMIGYVAPPIDFIIFGLFLLKFL